MRVYLETYGCWLNRGESEVMRQLLEEAGFKVVESLEQADVIVINTCAVRGDTERNILRRIAELYHIASRREARLVWQAVSLTSDLPAYLE